MTKENDNFLIPVTDYLSHSITFHEREWKLVNRRVEKSQVYLSSHEAVRLVRKELGNYIVLKIQSLNLPEMYPAFEEPIKKLVRP